MTGITVYDNMTHPRMGWYAHADQELTVNCDGNDFAQNPAIGSLEGRNSTQWVELLVFGGETISRVRLDILDIKVVLLCNSPQDHSSGIAL